MAHQYKIAYISRVIYPSPAAHALQTIQMAAAFANRTNDTHLFVRDLVDSEDRIRQSYAIGNSPLNIWSMHSMRLPSRLRRYYTRPDLYNSTIATILSTRPTWARASRRHNVLFVRGFQDFTYWGLIRSYLPWFRSWTFVYEAHDIAGIDPATLGTENTLDHAATAQRFRNEKQWRALRQYDLVLTVTQALADDLETWSNATLQPHVVRHASPFPRVSHVPKVRSPADQVVLGYIGTIDRYRGVDVLLRTMKLLPARFRLRLVGRVEQDAGWLDDLLGDPDINAKIDLIGRLPVERVVSEIDRCDILLQPASSQIVAFRYASPLKSYDYMVRGKPIIAADVPSHREILEDGVNARFYRHDDAGHLAACIQSLAEQPRQAESLAKAAWEQAVDYNYDARARRILALIDSFRG